ncbi:photosynthetic protein synthase I [Alginatibacterium sediminis]|uniref:Photosynthetic protein synthase I n=1 Tax=Alginatibacterium sediminis TaxID=2164068 RepID=A0A420EL80_9ALTE|nr:cytochrome c peroxidase [Alginatibacterium sediminis]RKF21467.1 photosynthetic protein synthase I [Alginatibacterium sediminis]
MKKMLILAATAVFSLTAHGQDTDMKISALPELKVDTAKAELGKRLFFDKRLSGNTVLSCASCHEAKFGFANSSQMGPAYTGSEGFRNVPSLMNTAYKKSWFHDGRLGTNLNDVTRENLTEDWLMNMDMRLMQERLKQDPIYVAMFKEAGMGEPSNGGVRNAIPEYLKTLLSEPTAFDRGDLGKNEQAGLALFTGKAGCVACHSGPLLSDGKAHNTGVPENLEIFRDPMRHQTFIAFNMFMGVENYMNLKRDVGAHVQKHKADGSDMGKFMTPSLRELVHTAPYMHNGMLASLEDVVAFYNVGGGEDSHKDPAIKPLDLSDQEQKDLVSFLRSLSGELLDTDKHVWSKNDYKYEVITDWKNVKN